MPVNRAWRRWTLAKHFATPHHSWERGTNENTNGLIRQYLPKRTSMERLPRRDCTRIAQKLNQRSRKCLGFRTPEECYEPLHTLLHFKVDFRQRGAHRGMCQASDAPSRWARAADPSERRAFQAGKGASSAAHSRNGTERRRYDAPELGCRHHVSAHDPSDRRSPRAL